MRSVLAGLLALVVAGCSQAGPGDEVDPVPTSPPEAMQYAALGDSYTAAPYVVSTDVANGCLRSTHNYPQRLAGRLGASLADVSCGSATTEAVTGEQHTVRSAVQPPQIEAVTADTDLVTIGMGGNDGSLFGRLVSGCPMTGPDGRSLGASGRCGHLPRARLDELLAETRSNLVRVLRAITEAAPDATVVLVGYPRLLGDAPCDELPIAPADVATASAAAVLLRDAQRAAARQAGVDFIDIHDLSAGHDACSAQPWVNGVHTSTTDGAAMHPTRAGEEAMADAIADHLPEARS